MSPADQMRSDLNASRETIRELVEALRASKRQLFTAQVLMEGSGFWKNAAGYVTDAALWIDQAQATIDQALKNAEQQP